MSQQTGAPGNNAAVDASGFSLASLLGNLPGASQPVLTGEDAEAAAKRAEAAAAREAEAPADSLLARQAALRQAGNGYDPSAPPGWLLDLHAAAKPAIREKERQIAADDRAQARVERAKRAERAKAETAAKAEAATKRAALAAKSAPRIQQLERLGRLRRFEPWVVTADGALHCILHPSCSISADDLKVEFGLKRASETASLLQREGAMKRYLRAETLNDQQISRNHDALGWQDHEGKALLRARAAAYQVHQQWKVAKGPSVSSEGRSAIPPRLRFQVLQRDNFRCQLCGRNASDGVKLEVDHSHPASQGGADALENLWTLCFDCNRGKSDLDLLSR